MKFISAILLLLLSVLQGLGDNAGLIRDAKRIVVLGDSITYAGLYVAWVEAWLTMKYPNRERTVINLGLPSETVSGLSEEGHAGGRFPRPDLHERYWRVLKETKPDVILACYGMNCGIYQPAADERFTAYKKGILKLREGVADTGRTVIHITPWAYDHSTGKTPTKDYNQAVLGRYAKWLLDQRREGWHVIDLHGPMTAEIARRKEADPKFTFQRDGIHPNREGHWFAAQQVIGYFGDQESASAPDAGTMMAKFKGGAEILPLVESRMGLLRNAWLSHTKHLRPGVKAGLSLEEAEKRAEEYGLLIEHKRVGVSPSSGIKP